MARPLTLLPEDGPYITLGDLEDFVREARAKGYPERQQIRVKGAIEINLAHGPRVQQLTVVPDEVSDE